MENTEILPVVRFFNPTADYAIGNGTVSWQPPAFLAAFEADLELLPIYFSGRADILLVRQQPSECFLSYMKQLGIVLPEIIVEKEALGNREFLQRNFYGLEPWGWSQVIHKRWQPLIKQCSKEIINGPLSVWNPDFREVFSRRTAKKVLENFARKAGFGHVDMIVPEICFSVKEVEQFHRRVKKTICKAPWSSSGRGLQMITQPGIHRSIVQRLEGIIAQQGFIMAEPLLNKVMDFAYQFRVSNFGVDFLGMSWFYTNNRGQYLGNHLNKPINDTNRLYFDLIESAEKEIVGVLREEIMNYIYPYYRGIVGVDALLYTDETGKRRINPCLEINIRNNMGYLALFLTQQFGKSYQKFCIDRKENIPSNALILTDIIKAQHFAAFLLP